MLLSNTFRPVLVIFRHTIIKQTESVQFHSMCYINNCDLNFALFSTIISNCLKHDTMFTIFKYLLALKF